MLDFAFGPNGYGLTEGMRKEQDRITQNRSAFANNMATFLANNPYISPEAAQAFINSAAGTDNTLRGSVPNQLIGELNKENTRKRRIDTFQAFNEFTRLNPGATAAEFQSAMSALGAQGIYGADALKAIQGRSDQYRKDQETKRMFDQAQNIGQLRTTMMNDVDYQYAANGYDPDKTLKAMKAIYGDKPPVPYETMINPGSASVAKQKVIRDYLPKAVEILNNNPKMTPEMLYGIWPELQGSPIVKSIYDAAQTERKKEVEKQFHNLDNRKRIVDAVAQAYELNLDPQLTYKNAALGVGLPPEDVDGFDNTSIMAEAQAISKKSKDDQQQKLDASLAGAKGKMYESLRTNTLADPLTLQTLANGDITAVESFVRARIRDESGLTEAEISKIPDKYYSSLAQSIRQQIIANANIEQQKLYETVVGSESKIRSGIVEKSIEAAKNFTSNSAVQQIKNAGLEQSVAGAAIPTIMSQLAQQYDVTGVNGTTIFNYLIAAAQKQPEADMATLLNMLPGEVLVPINDLAQKQVEQMQFETGALSNKPIRATDFVSQKSSKLYASAQNQITTVIEISKDTNMSVEDRILAMQSARQQILNGVTEEEAYFEKALGFDKQWDFNDRFNNTHYSALSKELRDNSKRVIDLIDSSLNVLQKQMASQQRANLAPAELAGSRADGSSSRAYNYTIGAVVPTDYEQTISDMGNAIAGSLPAYPDVPGGGPINLLNPSNLFSSQDDIALSNQIMSYVNNPVQMAKIYNRPDIWALIDPRSPTRDPVKFLRAMQEGK